MSHLENKYKNAACVACEYQNIQVEETQEHVFTCETLNKLKPGENFSEIYTHKTGKIKQIIKIFLENMKTREN